MTSSAAQDSLGNAERIGIAFAVYARAGPLAQHPRAEAGDDRTPEQAVCTVVLKALLGAGTQLLETEAIPRRVR